MGYLAPDEELLDLLIRLVDHLDPPPGQLVDRVQLHLDAAG